MKQIPYIWSLIIFAHAYVFLSSHMVCLYFHKFFSINMFHLNFYVYGFHTSYFLVHMVFIFIYIFYFLRIFLSNVYFLIPYICHFKNKFFPYISFFPTKLTKIDFVFLFLNMCFFHQCFISPKICFFSIFNMCFLHRYTKLFFSIDFFSNSWIGFSNIYVTIFFLLMILLIIHT